MSRNNRQRVPFRVALGLWSAGAAALAPVGVVGALITSGPDGVAMTTLAAALTGAGLAHLGNRTTLSPRRSRGLTAAVTSAGTVVATGLVGLLGGIGLLLSIVAAATGWGLSRWHHRLAPTSTGVAGQQGTDDELTRLCTAWRISSAALAGCTDPDRRARLAGQRQELLAEIEQHAPDGLQRWLECSPDGSADPLRWLVTPRPRDGN